MYAQMQAQPMTSFSGSSDFGTAEQWVCHHVRRWILEGTLGANEEINQQDVANRLGVSRSPVRDALRRQLARRQLARRASIAMTPLM